MWRRPTKSHINRVFPRMETVPLPRWKRSRRMRSRVPPGRSLLVYRSCHVAQGDEGIHVAGEGEAAHQEERPDGVGDVVDVEAVAWTQAIADARQAEQGEDS